MCGGAECVGTEGWKLVYQEFLSVKETGAERCEERIGTEGGGCRAGGGGGEREVGGTHMYW